MSAYQFKPPFEIYHEGTQIADKDGHVCSAESPEIAIALVGILNGSTAAPLAWDHPSNRSYEPVEKRAAEIYAGFDYDGPGEKPEWVIGGNSLKQDLARYDARKELKQ